MTAALWTEGLKLLRSKTPLVTSAAFLLPVLLAGVFVLSSGASGTIGAKAQALGISPDWPGFHAALTQIDAAGGFVLFGIVMAWTFGREFSDRTALDLLALPTSRGAIVVAKFAVTVAWLLVISVFQAAAYLLAGALLALPGSPGVGLGDLATLLTLNIVLTLPVAVAASAGRGYLPGVGATGVFVVAGVAFAAAGAGAWFPWSVPALASGLMGPAAPPPGTPGLLIAAATGLAGVALTVTWWRTADHT